MKKSKRWEIDNRYYKTRKFDRSFVDNFEGTRMPMHALRDRRNYRQSHIWIPCKYLEGLLKKYIDKPIEALEEAYNRKTKNMPNVESFEEAFGYLFEELNHSKWRSNFKYTIINGIITKNPEYKIIKYHWRRLKPYQIAYNQKHVINPGEVRNTPIYDFRYIHNVHKLKVRKPIYLGKLFARVNNTTVFIDIYHFYPEFLYSRKLNQDAKLQRKKETFEQDWIKVETGIKSLDYFKKVPNPEIKMLEDSIRSQYTENWYKEELIQKLKITPTIVSLNYGLGIYLYTVCKKSDLARLINSSQH